MESVASSGGEALRLGLEIEELNSSVRALESKVDYLQVCPILLIRGSTGSCGVGLFQREIAYLHGLTGDALNDPH